jgi:adenine-specific DNA-methyltransferase
MVSGLDKAFKIDDISGLNKYEQACIIKIIKAKDLGKYLSNNISNYIFIPEGLTIKEFKSKYTHFCEHFKPYLSELSERYQYGREIPYWEFVFPRNKKNLFDRPSSKIFVPCKERISNKRYFRFTIASKDVYPLQDVTAIYKKNNCKESIEYILAYLNNRRVFDWLLFNGVIKGDIVEFSEAPIASIPYLPINWNEPQQVNVHNEIAQNVHQYIATRESIFLTRINDLFNKLFRL